MSVRCFLPCRAGSERVPKKNIKSFSGFDGGLFEIKIKQLLEAELIDEVVLSTNDNEIIRLASEIGSERLVIHRRDDALCTSQTSTDDLVQHAADLIPNGHILWTHVTSPFITAKTYDAVIQRYFNALSEGFDSLMTTTLIHGFLWDESAPLNYDRAVEKWPRTQTISPVHEVNSAAFLFSANGYRECNDRIGRRPLLHPLDKIQSFDIDWPEDFLIAEIMAKEGVAEL